MLSDAIITHLAATIPGLVVSGPGRNIFAESASGKSAADSYAVVRSVTVMPVSIDQGRTDFGRDAVQVLTFGRSRDSWLLAQAIASTIASMRGDFQVAPGETYTFTHVEHRNGPIQLRDEDAVLYSSNFLVDYRLVLTI